MKKIFVLATETLKTSRTAEQLFPLLG